MSRILAVAWCLAVVAACVAGAAWTDRAGGGVTATAGQRWLDEHLVWAGESLQLQWTPVSDGRLTVEGGRSSGRFYEDRRMDGTSLAQWTAEGPPNPNDEPALRKAQRGPTGHSPCPPVLGDGRLYVAVDPRSTGCRVFAYDLGRPPQTGNLPLGGVSTLQQLVRRPLWLNNTSLLADNPASGMAYAGGRLYVGGAAGWVDALYGPTGSLLWQVPSDPVVGAPVPATFPTGERVIVVNCWRGATGSLIVLDEGTGQARWGAWTPVRPMASPVVTGDQVLIAGVGSNHRPCVAAYDLPSGNERWTFQAYEDANSGDARWGPSRGDELRWSMASGRLERRQPGGLVAVAAPDGGSSTAYFACGQRLYAIDLGSGHQRWNHEPAFDAAAVASAKAIRSQLAGPVGSRWDSDRWGELPELPWLTAPAVYGDEVIFGTPDGLRAVAAADGRPRWRLPERLVGAVDQTPVVSGGVLYTAGEGWIGGPADLSDFPLTCAIRLDAPNAAPLLTAARTPLRCWPWAAAAIVLVSLGCAAATARAPAPRFGRADGAAMACVIIVALVVALWVAFQLRHGPPSASAAINDHRIYAGPTPFAAFGTAAVMAFLAAVLAMRRGRKLALAAGLSAIVGAGAAAFWVRGRHSGDSIGVKAWDLRPDRVAVRERGLVSAAGGFRLQLEHRDRSLAAGMAEPRTEPFVWDAWTDPTYPAAGPIDAGYESGTVRTWRGFQAQSRTTTYGGPRGQSHLRSVTVPAWSVVAAAAVLPAGWFGRLARRWHRRRRGRRQGRCPACGYDLRASPGRCPECGAMAVGAPAASAAAAPPP